MRTKRFLILFSVLGLLAALTTTAYAAANAQPAHAVGATTDTVTAATATSQDLCSVATLKGRYLFAHYGTALPPAFGVTEPTQAGDAGFHIFNGDGTGTDVTVRVGTTVALENASFTYTYTVNADCTGHYSVPDGPSFDLFVSPKGDSFAIISTATVGNYVSDIDYRVSPQVELAG